MNGMMSINAGCLDDGIVARFGTSPIVAKMAPAAKAF
jgi:hypothetical protein